MAIAPRLVLASSSPRRRRLLREHGFDPDVRPPPIDDAELARPPECSPLHWVVALAYIKARTTQLSLADPRAAVLGADTVVIKNGAVIGQPRDREHAERIIRALADGSHHVASGVAILAPDAPRSLLVDVARVTVGRIDDEALADYLQSGDWRGKAGAYNLIERIQAGWPISCEGDPGTVMGLPMRLLGPVLARTLSSQGRVPNQ